MQYPFVANVANDIRSTLKTQVNDFTVADIKGKLNAVVERENAEVVVALGVDAVAEALRLPPDISVVYGLVVMPPKSSRTNLTGVYMSPPVSEYISTVRRYFPAIDTISVIGSPTMVKSLGGGTYTQVTSYQVNSSSDLVNTVGRLGKSDALILLPDVNLLTSSAMENLYAFSFRRNIPLLGISEGNVKQGALFALVFDAKTTSWQIGEKVQNILNGDDAGEIPSSPPGKYNLFLNTNTARKMGLKVPDELLKRSKKVFQ
jgi:ABC-type uncharacterized transport system substrate-binding protein